MALASPNRLRKSEFKKFSDSLRMSLAFLLDFYCVNSRELFLVFSVSCCRHRQWAFEQ
jgi:hypothetical protein